MKYYKLGYAIQGRTKREYYVETFFDLIQLHKFLDEYQRAGLKDWSVTLVEDITHIVKEQRPIGEESGI